MNWLAIKIILAMFVVGVTLSCGGGGAATQPPPPPAGSYYIDCSASTNGNGTLASPWNTLANANALTLSPGNELLFQRGTTCQGTLNPLGSGSSAAPIIVDAYGTGAQPVINGGANNVGGTNNNATVLLTDQQYWEIRNLEIAGGTLYGIHVTGNTSNSSLNHFHFINLNVHVALGSNSVWNTGQIFIEPAGIHQVVNDVLIDGVIAYGGQIGNGIWIEAGGDWNTAVTACQQQQPPPTQDLGSNITIQNTLTHDIYGNGVVVFVASNVLMQNNVIYNTGICPPSLCGSDSTPGGLWESCCISCTVQNNESYANRTFGQYDGADFGSGDHDLDNISQYNYGHDSDGYCWTTGSGSLPADTNDIFRYNICSNDNRNGTIQPQGEILIDAYVIGSQVYNNTLYWNPDPAVSSAAALYNYAYASTNLGFFENNIIYGAGPGMIQSVSGYTLNNNIYWTTSTSPPTWQWQWQGTTYTDFSAYQAASGQDANSLYADPLLNDPTYHAAGKSTTAFTLQTGSPAIGTGTNVCSGISGCNMGTQDFFGNPLPNGSGYDIGANQAPQ